MKIQTHKQTSASKKKKAAVAARAQKKLKAKVKVVEVKLKTQKKKEEVLKSRAKKTQKEARDKKTVSNKKNIVFKGKKVSNKIATKQTITKQAPKTFKKTDSNKKASYELQSTQTKAYDTKSILSLADSISFQDLKPFRSIAKRNRLITREKNKVIRVKQGFYAKQAKKGKRFAIDLRIHSPASLGYLAPEGVEVASALVRLAKAKGIKILGITDFYSAHYVDKVKEEAKNFNISIIPGFDLRCKVVDCNEVFFTALFPEETTSEDIFKVLRELEVPESAYGQGNYCLSLPVEKIIEIVEKNGGVLIPTCLDRTPYRQLAIPSLIDTHGFHAFDVLMTDQLEFFKKRWPQGGFTFFSFSNANSLGQVGNRRTKIRLEEPTFSCLKEVVARRIGEAN